MARPGATGAPVSQQQPVEISAGRGLAFPEACAGTGAFYRHGPRAGFVLLEPMLMAVAAVLWLPVGGWQNGLVLAPLPALLLLPRWREPLLCRLERSRLRQLNQAEPGLEALPPPEQLGSGRRATPGLHSRLNCCSLRPASRGSGVASRCLTWGLCCRLEVGWRPVPWPGPLGSLFLRPQEAWVFLRPSCCCVWGHRCRKQACWPLL